MTAQLSPNSKVILALAAPFPGDAGDPEGKPILSDEEYGLLAERLQVLEARPSDFAGEGGAQLIRDCSDMFDPDRLEALLTRLPQAEKAAEAWEKAGVWFLTRADRAYPRTLKNHLREDAPPVIWGAGSIDLVRGAGFAVAAGSASNSLSDEKGLKHGELAAYAGITVISTGKSGAEAAALRGALKKKGPVCQVPGKPLDAFVTNPSWQKLIAAGRLALVSPYPPGFPADAVSEQTIERTSMALADCALLINPDSENDPAWLAAEELLGKYETVPLFYWAASAPTPALEELADMGMEPVPEFGGVVDFHAFVKGKPEAPAEPEVHKPGEYEEVPPEEGEEKKESEKPAPASVKTAEPAAEELNPDIAPALEALKGRIRELAAMEGMTGDAILEAVVSELTRAGRIDPVIGSIITKVGYSKE